MMQGPVSATVLCIREIGDPYVILNSFACGKKSRPLSIIVHKDTVSPPAQQNRLLLELIQTFPVSCRRGICSELASCICLEESQYCFLSTRLDER